MLWWAKNAEMHAGRYGRVFAELCVRDFVARWCASFRLPLPPLPPVRQLGGAVRRRKRFIWWRMRALADPPCHFYLPLNCVATGMQLTQLSLHAEEARAAAGARPPRPPAHNGTFRPHTTRHQAVTRAGRGSLLSNGPPQLNACLVFPQVENVAGCSCWGSFCSAGGRDLMANHPASLPHAVGAGAALAGSTVAIISSAPRRCYLVGLQAVFSLPRA